MADQLIGDGNREEEETGIFLAGSIVILHAIMTVPVHNAELDQLFTAKDRISNEMMILKFLHNGKGLVLKTYAKPFCQFSKRTYPFSGTDDVTDTFDALIRSAKIGIAVQQGIME